MNKGINIKKVLVCGWRTPIIEKLQRPTNKLQFNENIKNFENVMEALKTYQN